LELVILVLIIFLMDGLQELYALDKVDLPVKHHQIDGIIIFLTLKASGQIGFRIYGGIKPVAEGTKKTKAPLCHPTRDMHFFDEHPNVDLISKGIKPTGRKAPMGHVRLPDQAWVSS
jgi:hypothetical protein